MKRILTSTNAVIFFLLFAVLVSINSCKNISGCTKERQKESWLFTQTAESGSVTYDKNSKIYTVKLKGANPITVKFTDIPVRKASPLKTEKFVKEWQTMFSKEKPNATFVALEHTKDKGLIEEIAVCTILDIDYDSINKVITYKVKELPGANSFAIDSTGKELSDILYNFGPAIVFIDSAQIGEDTPPPPGRAPFPVYLKNNSNLPADDIYVTIYGRDDSKAAKPDSLTPFNYVKLNKESGSLEAILAKSDDNGSNYSFKLTDLKKTPQGYLMEMCELQSGRVYLSFGKPVDLPCGSDSSVSEPSLTGSDLATPCDKFEFSMLHSGTWLDPATGKNTPKGTAPYFNTTNVDSFSIPITIQGDYSSGPGPKFGFTKSRQEVLESFCNKLGNNADWKTLLQTYIYDPKTQPTPANILRVLAPQQCIVPNYMFNKDYITIYLNAVSNAYEKTSIIVDCREINGGLWSGNGLGNAFIFKNIKSGKKITFDFSHSPIKGSNITADLFGCVGWLRELTDSDTGDAASKIVIGKYLGAALNRGLLDNTQIPGSITMGDGNNGGPFWENARSVYYTNINPTNNQANYNLYSKILHDNGIGAPNSKVYGFAYDDVGGSDASVTDQSKEQGGLPIKSATITINDCTGLKYPGTEDKDKIWDVNFVSGAPIGNSKITYTVTDATGKNIIFSSSANQTIKCKSPVKITLVQTYSGGTQKKSISITLPNGVMTPNDSRITISPPQGGSIKIDLGAGF